MKTYYSIQFAQAYGEGNYSDCVYNDTTCSTGSAGGSNGAGATSGGGLSDTGLMVLVIVTLACLLVFIALVVRIWRRPSKGKLAEATEEAEQPVLSTGEDDNQARPGI